MFIFLFFAHKSRRHGPVIYLDFLECSDFREAVLEDFRDLDWISDSSVKVEELEEIISKTKVYRNS